MPRGDRLVVDASVAAKWFLTDEDYVDQARDLLVLEASGVLRLHAPDIIWLEVGSAITVATRGQVPRLTVEVGERRIGRLLNVNMTVYSSRDHMLPAYRLVHEHGCALYDALYLALADNIGVPFITADRRLFHRVGHLPGVLWLGDFQMNPQPNGRS